MSENKNPAISIVMPCYNSEQYIGRTLKSVFGQSFTDYELILVDDGSPDRIPEIIDKVKEEHPDKVSVFHKENGGQSTARNLALDHAKGEYIAFWDSDDYADADYLERLYTAAKEHDSDMVISGSHEVDPQGNIYQNLGYPVDLVPDYVGRRLSPHGKLYRKKFLDENNIRFVPGKIFEDNPFNLFAMFLSKNQVILPYLGHYQVIHKGSTMSSVMTADRMPFDELKRAMKYLNEHREDVNDWDVYEYTVLSFLTYFIFLGNRAHLRNAHRDKKGHKNMNSLIKQMCDMAQEAVPKYCPNFMKNPYLPLGRQKTLSLLQRAGTLTFAILVKTHLLKPFAMVYYAVIR